MVAPSLDEEMATIAGQEAWQMGPTVWVLGRDVRVKFEIANDAMRRRFDTRHELTRAIRETLADVIPLVAAALSSDASHEHVQQKAVRETEKRSLDEAVHAGPQVDWKLDRL